MLNFVLVLLTDRALRSIAVTALEVWCSSRVVEALDSVMPIFGQWGGAWLPVYHACGVARTGWAAGIVVRRI